MNIFLRKSASLIGNTRNNALFRSIYSSAVFWGKVVPFKLSDIGEGIAEVQVKEWHVKVGDRVAQFDNLCEVQSDKASVTITSRYDGVIKKLYYNVDDIAKVGLPLIDIELEESSVEATEIPATEQRSVSKPAQQASQPAHKLSESGKVLATPAVRRIAMENQVDLTKITPSRRDGRILKEDVLRFLGQAPEISAKPEKAQPAVSQPKIVPGQDTIVPVRGYTRAMIKSMSEALKIPHFGYNDEIRVDNLIELRSELKHIAKEKGIKLSYMPFFIKAASLALKQYPVINSSADEKFENIIYKASHNISLAMDTPGGLVVPNVKNCEQKNIWEIAADLNRLHELAKSQKLSREDLSGGTFALSNIGAIGGTYASPVIFAPQVAIGAIGRIQRVPRYYDDDAEFDSSDEEEDEVYEANIVNVSWAADHRVIDGATIARFSNLFKAYIEKPGLMVADMR